METSMSITDGDVQNIIDESTFGVELKLCKQQMAVVKTALEELLLYRREIRKMVTEVVNSNGLIILDGRMEVINDGD